MKKEANKFKAILFDFDGVIAKTMEDNFRAWQRAVESFGGSIDGSDYFPLEGAALSELAKRFCAQNNIDAKYTDDLVKKKEEFYLENNSFSLYETVEEYIAFLRSAGIPLGLVTAGLQDRVEKTVGTEFLKNFDAIVYGGTTEHGKPCPDPYQKAAELLSMQPHECIVIENAPLGITSAKQAGAYCIAIASTMGQEHLGEADEIVSAFRDVKELQTVKNIHVQR